MQETLSLLNECPTIFYLIVFIFSICVGSFLNVVIWRLPIKLNQEWTIMAKEFLNQELEEPKTFNLFFPHSHCPQCKQDLKAWHNIPILSFIFLKRRCYYCKKIIPYRYPLVELTTGLLSLVVAYEFGPTLAMLCGLLFTYILISLALIDFDTQLLPDELTIPLIWLGLLINTQGVFVPLNNAVLSAAGAYLFLWTFVKLFYLFTGKEGMGGGDLKLFAAFGAWMGWQVLPLILILSSFVGAILGSLILYLNRKNKDTPLPFGPYLCITGFISLVWGKAIISWYMSLYL